MKAEEERAWKKIQQTKVRAQEILRLREEAERRMLLRSKMNASKSDYTLEAKDQKYVMKELSAIEKKVCRNGWNEKNPFSHWNVINTLRHSLQKTQDEILNKKRSLVNTVKTDSREAQKAIARQKIEDRANAARNKELIRKHKEEVRIKRENELVRFLPAFDLKIVINNLS